MLKIKLPKRANPNAQAQEKCGVPEKQIFYKTRILYNEKCIYKTNNSCTQISHDIIDQEMGRKMVRS